MSGIMTFPTTSHEITMNLDETVRLQALKLKQMHTRGSSEPDAILDMFANDPANAEQLKALTRNICAHISVELFNEVEGLCEMLSLSKRRFVELALTEAIAKASSVVNEVSPFVPGDGEKH
jgi:hypothetical protein